MFEKSNPSMNELVYSGNGVEIFRHGAKLYVRYDEGHFVPEMREGEITAQEALRAQESEQGAYEVLVAVQNRNKS
jgi:hypothetical protein